MSMMVQPGRFGAAGIPTVTWNPSDKSPFMTLSGGDLTVTRAASGSGTKSVRATRGISAADNGYFELVLTDDLVSPFAIFGLSTASLNTDNYCGIDTNSWGYYEDTGQKYTNNAGAAYGASYKTNGIVLGCAFKNGKVWFHKSGTWQNSGDPAAGTGEAFSGITGTVFPTASLFRSTTAFVGRFKLADFSFTPPSGFAAWGT